MTSESSFNDSTDNESEAETPKKKKRGVRNIHLYKKEKQKSQRLLGQSYVSTSTGRLVPAKSNSNSDCLCKRNCTQQFSTEEKQQLFESVYNGRPKNEQDIYMMSLIEYAKINRHRSKRENPKKRDSTFIYFAMKGNEKIRVCRQAFSILYAIKGKAIFRLTSLKSEGKLPEDKRGRHRNRGNVLSNEAITAIDEHIRSFPLKESHYSSKHIQYLEANLNVKIMYELFLKKYPHYQCVKYDYYRKYFNDNHGYRFGRPQVDVCSTCEELEAKIKSSSLNENAKRVAVAEKIIHLKRAKKFYNKQKEVLALCKERKDVGAIVFDYMQNLPIPKIPVQEMFYLRKLWLYVFCVHDLKTNSADFYTYHEGEAKRGPDEVCSLLWKTIQNMDPSVKELHVFSDACGGQNRNNTLIRFFLTLVAKNRFEKIYQYFPVRGHSFLQCDRNFGTAKRLIRRRDRIYVPNEYNNLISAAKIRGFSVKPVSSNEILDFKNSWQQCFKKTCKSLDKATTFKISQYRSFEYSSSHKGYLTCSELIDGFVKATFLLQKPSTIPKIPETLAYVTKIPINEKKMNDIKKIIQYIPDEFKDFYNLILTWPTTRSESEEIDE